jgi:prepilin-type N-terminal cleavage/methylation domain-containing protein
MRNKLDEKGITLIELMVALVICGIIVAAIYRVFVAQTRAYTTQEEVGDIQQNVRNAMELLIQDIRMAGFDNDKTSNVSPPDPPIAPFDNQIIIFYEDDTIPAVRTVTYYIDANNRLMRNQVPPSTPPAEPGGDPILDNVGIFNLLYEVDQNGDYRQQWEVPAAGIGNRNIVGVRVQLSGVTPPNLPDLANVSPRMLDTVVTIRNQINKR